MDMSGEQAWFVGKRFVIDQVTGKGERDTQIARTIAKKSQCRAILPKKTKVYKTQITPIRSTPHKEEGGGQSHHL